MRGGRTPIEQRVENKTMRDEASGCWVWTGALNLNPRDPSRGGYGYTSRVVDGRAEKVYVHRWAYERYVGPIPEGLFVMHRCDNRRCWNPEHLTTGSASDNTTDMLRKGRGLKTVTPDDVREIRALYKPYSAEFGRAALARRFGVSTEHVGRIARGLSGPPIGVSGSVAIERATIKARDGAIRDLLRYPTERACVVCGAVFRTVSRDRRARACSASCGGKLATLVHAGHVPSRADIRARGRAQAHEKAATLADHCTRAAS